MCLAIPAKIVKMEANSMAEVDILGVSRHVSVDLVPDAGLGDFVLIHAGFAIQAISEEDAQETLQILKDISLVDPEVEFTTGEA